MADRTPNVQPQKRTRREVYAKTYELQGYEEVVDLVRVTKVPAAADSPKVGCTSGRRSTWCRWR